MDNFNIGSIIFTLSSLTIYHIIFYYQIIFFHNKINIINIYLFYNSFPLIIILKIGNHGLYLI